jgi:hypothetical protein
MNRTTTTTTEILIILSPGLALAALDRAPDDPGLYQGRMR